MERNNDLIFGYGRFKCLGQSVALMELNKVFVEVRCSDPMRAGFAMRKDIGLKFMVWLSTAAAEIQHFADRPFEAVEFSKCGHLLAERDVGSHHTEGRRYGLKSCYMNTSTLTIMPSLSRSELFRHGSLYDRTERGAKQDEGLAPTPWTKINKVGQA